MRQIAASKAFGYADFTSMGMPSGIPGDSRGENREMTLAKLSFGVRPGGDMDSMPRSAPMGGPSPSYVG
jgi:hypothetical protein